MIREYCNIIVVALVIAILAVAATVDNMHSHGMTTVLDQIWKSE